MPVTIGADPELFVCNAHTKKIVSCIGQLGGTKDEPLPTEHGFVQEDNVLAEFNIHPATTAKEFVTSLRDVQVDINSLLASKGLKVKKGVSSHHFEKEYLIEQGAKALEFGCDPDFNAWSESTTAQNESPNPYTTLRTAGGHVHLGFDLIEGGERSYHTQLMVQALDCVLGLPSVLLDPDTERRTLYGQAGAYRSKVYGLEYRTLSNFWLKSAKLQKFIFHNTKALGDYYNQCNVTFEDEVEDIIWDLGDDSIESTINDSDRLAAAGLYEQVREAFARVEVDLAKLPK